MTVEISQPEGLDLENKLEETNAEAFFTALPEIFKSEKISLCHTEENKLAIDLPEYNSFIVFDFLEEKEELEKNDYNVEDGVVVRLSLHLVSLEFEDGTPVDEDHMLTPVMELVKFLEEKDVIHEFGYFEAKKADIYLSCDLTNTPQLKTIVDITASMLEFAEEEMSLVHNFFTD